jgi:hypothetical protein
MKKKLNQPANPVAMGIGLIKRRMKKKHEDQLKKSNVEG